MLFQKLSQISTAHVITLSENASIHDAVDLMDRQNIRDVVVTGGAELRMITARELMTLRVKEVDFNQTLASIDLQPINRVAQDSSIIDGLNALKDGAFEYLCLVNPQGELTGIVSYSDIALHLDPYYLSEFKRIDDLVHLSDFTAVQSSATIKAVLLVLLSDQQEAAIVERNGVSVGIVTQQDITHALAQNTPVDAPIAQIMTSPLITLDVQATLQKALSFSREHKIKRIVVTSGDKVVGLLHQKDLVALVYENWCTLLEEQKRHLQAEKSLFQGGPVLLFIWRAEDGWPVNYVSDNVLTLLGYRPSELLEASFKFIDLVHPDDQARMALEIATFVSEKRTYWEQSYRIRQCNGDYRWFYDYTRPTYDEQGQLRLIYGYLLDQTELIEAKNQAQQMQTRLEMAMEASETGLWVWNMQTHQISWSDQTFIQLGYAAQAFEVNLAVFKGLVHPSDIEAVMNAIQQQVIERKGFVVEYRVKAASGAWIWIQGRGKVTKSDAEGEPLEMMGTHLNITQQKEASDNVQKNQQRLQNIIWGTGVGTWEWNVQTGETIFNEQWAEFIGYDLRQLQPTTIETWMQFAHPDDLSESTKQLKEHFSGQRDHYEIETRMRHKNGEWIWLLDRGKVVSWTADGQPEWLAGTHQDITQRKQAQCALTTAREALQRSQRLLEDGEKLASIGGWEYHVASQQMFWTKGLFDLHGFTPSADFDHIKQSIYCYLPADRDTIQQAFLRCVEQGESYDLVLPFIDHKKQPKWIRTKTAPLIEQGQVTKVIGIVADISEQKQTEQRLSDLVKQANAASQAKSDFLANMSHEIRTPMNGIIGLSELALKQPNVDVLHQQLHKIYRSGRLLLGIINDILDFSKIEAGKLDIDPHPFYLCKMLDELGGLFIFSAQEKGLTWQVDLADDVPTTLMGDEMRLRQVLTNLLGNAIKFTEHGTVRLRIYKVLDHHQAWLRFEINDSGMGLSEVQKTRLFQPFSQTDNSITRKHGGTGLGLVISQRLVQAMGGDKIEVESQLEMGSTFSFNLPLNPCSEQQTAQLKAKMAKVAHDAPRLSGHILLVEDNEINQEVAQEQLRQMGFRVSLAENGKVAVENVKQQHFDLVLMDIQMPVMDGYQATQAIRQFNGDIPIIALTAAAMIEDKQKALKVGMNGHLSKPIHSEQLRALLAETLAASNAHGDTKNDQAWEDELRTINSIAVPVINVEQGLLQLGGNRVLYDKLLQKFATQLATDFADLVNDLTQLAKSEPASDRIWTHLQRQNHALKGVAGNLAMDALHQQSKQMDLLLKGHSAPSPQQVAEFAQSFLATQAKLAELAELTALAKSPHQPNVDSTLAVDGVKVSHVLKALHKLLPHIEQSEFVDEPALQAIFEQLPLQNHQAWSQVTQYLDDFDFEQAAHALRRLINALS